MANNIKIDSKIKEWLVEMFEKSFFDKLLKRIKEILKV